MSHNIKRNQALPVLQLIEASQHSSKRDHELWPPTKYPTPPSPAALASEKGLKPALSQCNCLTQLHYRAIIPDKENNRHFSYLYHLCKVGLLC